MWPPDAIAQLAGEFGLRPVVGLEMEWYVRPTGHAAPYALTAQERDGYLDALYVAASASALPVWSFEEERGPGQFEAALTHLEGVASLPGRVALLSEVVQDVGYRRGMVTDFSAKPYPSHYGSGLHLHVHLEDAAGKNVFRKRERQLSPELEAALAGLLADAPRRLDVFAPTEASRERFVPGCLAPVKLCWGTNNRTAALRLPDGTAHLAGVDALARITSPDARRIEHRIAGSDACPEAVITAVLEGILLGLRERPPLPAPVFGNAGDAQYDYPPILGV